jgi:hypothetical protein
LCAGREQSMLGFASSPLSHNYLNLAVKSACNSVNKIKENRLTRYN